MIEAGAQFKVEVSGDDLQRFADRLIEKARQLEPTAAPPSVATEEKWLTAADVAKLCRVSVQTVHAWNKSGYLTSSKVGRKQFYPQSKVTALLNGTRHLVAPAQ